ncbi:aspartate kinase [Saccharomycopsis crataegensis]|uniref:Aspartokinase n=1 Tax=Saccharomycopsis crataegensis TaxID=43959 RepID=A0AAV5QNZ9_9ASCO|nr:aspartate kinase [Saccharomycopsis crataegensis]
MIQSSSTISLSSLNGNHGWVIQKFGGTSVGKFPEKIVDDVVSLYNSSNKIAVVCSARSSNTKSEGTTSRLILSADRALEGGNYKEIIDLVKEDHVNNATLRIKDPEIKAQLIKETLEICDQTATLLHAATVVEEISYKTLDTIISAGERLSCLFVAALMNDRGIPAKFIDLSFIIAPVKASAMDAASGSSAKASLDQEFYDSLAGSLAEAVNKEIPEDSNVVPVLTGYFGVVPGGLLNNIGRGYTDLCAALVAVGLDADELQIWKEVDGIFTADPRKVTNARLLPTVTPDEAAELTYYGSEVIHPFTMEQVIRAKIPIIIKNVENPLGKGTIIYPDNIGRKGEATPPHPPLASALLSASMLNKKKAPTAVTVKHDIVVINVHSNKKTLSHGFLAKIFAILDKYRLVVDLISTSEVHVSMALYNCEDGFHPDLRRAMKELSSMGTVDLVKNFAIVSLVGKEMRHLIGIAGAMFECLAKEKINIEMISQGANEINISCVVNESDSLKALQAIHRDLLDEVEVHSRVAQLKLEN